MPTEYSDMKQVKAVIIFEMHHAIKHFYKIKPAGMI